MADEYDDAQEPLPPDAQMQLARIAALRGQNAQQQAQQQASLGDASRVGLMLQMTGDRVAAPVGQGLLARAQQERSLEAMAPVKLLAARAQAERAGAYDDQVHKKQFRTAGDKESGTYDPISGTWTPQVAAPPPRPARGVGGAGGPSTKQQTLEERTARQLATYLQKGDGSQQFQQDLEKRAAAQNLKALDEGGGKINPAMVQEATMALARLVQGGSPTEGTLHAMVPHTAGMDLAKALQYVTGTPADAGAQQFIKYMMQTADREQRLSEQRILQARLEGVRASGLRKMNPDRFRQIIAPYFDEGMVDTFDGTPEGLSKVQQALEARRSAAHPKPQPSAEKLAKAQKWLADPKNANDPNRAGVEATMKRLSNGG